MTDFIRSWTDLIKSLPMGREEEPESCCSHGIGWLMTCYDCDLARAKDLVDRYGAEIDAARRTIQCDAWRRSHERPLVTCAAGQDGECGHEQCPQLRDNEPNKSGRHCPLDVRGEDD